MEKLPILGLAGWSGTGKTTLLEKLLPALRRRGVLCAVIKHDVHGLASNEEGKDSQRLRAAGAAQVIVCAPAQGPQSLAEALAQVSGVGLCLVEGFKNADIPQLGLSRRANGKGFTAPPARFCALVTDEAPPATGVPCFGLGDIEQITDFILENIMDETKDFTHFNAAGRAKMVDVGDKASTRRRAVAEGKVLVNAQTFALIRSGGMKKGDVLTVAQIAGVMGAKKTPELIPMCHPILMDGIDLDLSLDEERSAVVIRAAVSCDGRTGVEMEALTAVSVAALTVYDMCKAVQKDMEITDVRLLSKSGGVHGDFRREET